MTKIGLTGKFSAALPMTTAAKIAKRSKAIDVLLPPLHFWSRFLTGFTLISEVTEMAFKKVENFYAWDHPTFTDFCRKNSEMEGIFLEFAEIREVSHKIQ